VVVEHIDADITRWTPMNLSHPCPDKRTKGAV
jgi:hypothetical protein